MRAIPPFAFTAAAIAANSAAAVSFATSCKRFAKSNTHPHTDLFMRSIRRNFHQIVLAFATLILVDSVAADNTCLIVCPANISLATAPGGETVPYCWTVNTLGICGGVVQTAGLLPGSNFPIGTTTNAFRALDPPNQTCLFTVTVTATPSELLFADGFEILPRTFP